MPRGPGRGVPHQFPAGAAAPRGRMHVRQHPRPVLVFQVGQSQLVEPGNRAAGGRAAVHASEGIR